MSCYCGQENCPECSPESRNPLHQFGYGRGDDLLSQPPPPTKPRVTQAYSMIDPNRIVNVGDKKVDPTVPMDAVETLTVKDVVHRLIERNLPAWRALPERVRDRILERPQDFQLIGNPNRAKDDFDYNILYNGTIWRFHSTALVWTLHEVLR